MEHRNGLTNNDVTSVKTPTVSEIQLELIGSRRSPRIPGEIRTWNLRQNLPRRFKLSLQRRTPKPCCCKNYGRSTPARTTSTAAHCLQMIHAHISTPAPTSCTLRRWSRWHFPSKMHAKRTQVGTAQAPFGNDGVRHDDPDRISQTNIKPPLKQRDPLSTLMVRYDSTISTPDTRQPILIAPHHLALEKLDQHTRRRYF